MFMEYLQSKVTSNEIKLDKEFFVNKVFKDLIRVDKFE